MTTTLAAPAARTTTVTARTGFAALMRAEWISLTSLRGSVMSLIAAAFLFLAPAAGFAWLYGKDLASVNGDISQAPWIPGMAELSSRGMMFVIAVAALVGAASIAKEHSTGSLRTQLTAAPKRLTLISAKATVIAVTVFIATVILLLVSFAVTYGVGSIFALPLGIDSVLYDFVLPTLGSALFAAATAVFSLGLGAMLRSETWAVTIALVFLYVAPMIIMQLPWAWAADVADVLLFNTGGALTMPVEALSGDYLADVIITIAWGAVAFFGGAAVMSRKDA